MSSTADAYIGWAVALPDDFDIEEFDLDEIIPAVCGFTEPLPEISDRSACADWKRRRDAVVTVSYGAWGDFEAGESGYLLVTGETSTVCYDYEQVDPAALLPPTREQKDRLKAVLAAVNQAAAEPVLMMWVNYG